MNRRAVLLLIASVAAAATGKLRGADPGEVGRAAADKHELKGPLRSLAALVDRPRARPFAGRVLGAKKTCADHTKKKKCEKKGCKWSK
jgi:hypothetical protein